MDLQRTRVDIATRLLRGTPCSVARTKELRAIQQNAIELENYVETSGGLQEPRRIRAYRVILRRSLDISRSAARALVEV